MSEFIKLLPTTINVNENMSIKEALGILQENSLDYELVGEIVNGMYYSEDLQRIVEEELVPIMGDFTSQQLANIFNQECILEFNSNSAKLVSQDGEVWAEYNKKVEYDMSSIEEAVQLQRKMAVHFGGSSRIGTFVWSWASDEALESWAM